MCIYGLGVDLVSLNRIRTILEKRESQFSKKICHPHELQSVPQVPQKKIRFFSSLFAAKEALAKACGTGFSNGLWFSDIEILKVKENAPHIKVHGKFRALFTERSIQRVFLSFSYEKDFCVAVVVLEL